MPDTGVDHDGLAGLVSTLRSGTDDLDGIAGSMPESVDAGMSSQILGAALGSLAKAAAYVMADTEHSAAIIDTTSGAYGNTEYDNKDTMRGMIDELSSHGEPPR